MPRSQTPAGTVHLAITVSGLLPSSACNRRLSAPRRTPILMPATVHISEFNSAACALAFPLLRTPPLGDRTSGRLPAWWLAFGRAGLACGSRRTRWVTLANFKGLRPYPFAPSFARREHAMVVPLGSTGHCDSPRHRYLRVEREDRRANRRVVHGRPGRSPAGGWARSY